MHPATSLLLDRDRDPDTSQSKSSSSSSKLKRIYPTESSPRERRMYVRITAELYLYVKVPVPSYYWHKQLAGEVLLFHTSKELGTMTDSTTFAIQTALSSAWIFDLRGSIQYCTYLL